MIAGIFHEGSGLGNQLHRYVMTRVLALDKGFEWGMCNQGNFKGFSFMNLDMGKPFTQWTYDELFPGAKHFYSEKKVLNEFGDDVRGYDWEGVNGVKDMSVIDGEFQGEEYYKHRLDEIREWLQVEPLEMPDDLCVIGFRGGEYVGVPGLFLPLSYWETGIEMMREINPNMRFEVHTDDPPTAAKFFPDFKIVHDMGINWRSVRYAKYLLIANSSFYILPSLLNQDVKKILAPLYWAGRNKGYWQLEQNYYNKYTYI